MNWNTQIYKLMLIVSLVVFWSLTALAQDAVEVKHRESDENGSVTFTATNNTVATYSLIITFSELTDMSGFYGNSKQFVVSPGRLKLFTLTPSGANPRPRFNYTVSYLLGSTKPKVNNDIRYLIPIRNGKKSEAVDITYLGEKYGDQTAPEDFYAVGFKMNSGDTVCAARKGLVIELKDHHAENPEKVFEFKNEVNYVYVEHEDFTIGCYKLLKENGGLVEVGQTVIPGDPIGIIGAENFTSGSHVRFSVFYRKENPVIKGGQITSSNYAWAYVPIKFDIEGKKQSVKSPNIYTSIHDESIITQEMTKGQIKRRNKKKRKS